jgi:hypothetical protein
VYSPSGRLLATSHIGVIRLWDTATGKEVRQLRGHNGYVIDLAFSPEERYLASAAHSYIGEGNKSHEDWTVRLWDIAEGVEMERISQLYAGHLAFRPDGAVLVWLGQDQLRRLDVLSGQELASPANLDLTAVAFSPDGQWLATAHRGGVIRVREEATGQEIFQFQATPAGVDKLIWAADSKTLISQNGDATVLIWDLAPPGWEREGQQKDFQPEKLEQAWADLKSRDAPRAFRAVWLLASGGNAAIGLLKHNLRAVEATGRMEQIRRLVADLDHDEFTRRETASRELADLGLEARSALGRALGNKPSLEVRTRAKALLKQLAGTEKSPSDEDLRTDRALAVLERLGTPEAQQLLKTLSTGAPEARLTQQAKASLEWLARRPASTP